MSKELNKHEISALRVKYVRLMQRFIHATTSYLSKSEKLSKEGYAKKIKNAHKYLDRCQKVEFYGSSNADLQKFVDKIISSLDSDKKIEEIKDDILAYSNQLEKSHNAKTYKKDKHKNDKFKEW